LTTLDPIEYIDGFGEERFRDWQISITSRVKYTHYWLTLPNRDTRIKISGNFVVYIYNKYDDEEPLITSRLVVAESIGQIVNTVGRPTRNEFIHTGQQLNIDVLFKDAKFKNPQRDVSMTVIQNGDWSTAIQNVQARSYNANKFEFEKAGQISFLAGNEFRAFDTRSLLGRGYGVGKVNLSGDIIKVYLTKNIRRKNYLFDFDFNGNYFVDRSDDSRNLLFSGIGNNSSGSNLSDFRGAFLSPQSISEKDVRAEYLEVYFELETPKQDEKVYVYGAFTDFNIKPEFEMKYDEISQSYKVTALLKQGYYNYQFVVKGEKSPYSLQELEGNHSDTENEYLSLIYFRDFGARYDRVIGVQRLNSSNF
jgi:hypothetical protein